MKRTWCMTPVLGVCLLAVMFHPPLKQAESGVNLTFVANKSVTNERLTVEDVQNIFLGHRVRWNDNSQIHLVCMKDNDIHREFVRVFARRTPAQFHAWWRQMLFTGKGAMPRFLDNEREVIEFVERTRGAIGYVGTSPDAGNVRIITVE